jgi:Short-chain dehydrogenases of various substrate specificities
MHLPLKLTAIITGASTGIGRGLALALANIYKAKMVITARSNKDLESLKEEIEKRGGQAVIVAGDITDSGMTARLVESCIKEFGSLNLLVNNAGMAIPGAFSTLSEEDWRRVFEVNFFSTLTLTQQALPHLKAADLAKIVNISSVAGKVSFPGSISYCSSKFAMTALSEGLAAELHRDNIQVITVCPGWVRTEFFDKNAVPHEKNPTEIAKQNDLSGLLMKHVLSISTQDCVKSILGALESGKSKELILTLPGKFAERLHGTAPGVMHYLAKNIKVPAQQ